MIRNMVNYFFQKKGATIKDGGYVSVSSLGKG